MYSQTQIKKLMNEVSQLQDPTLIDLQVSLDTLIADNTTLKADLTKAKADIITAKDDIQKLKDKDILLNDIKLDKPK